MTRLSLLTLLIFGVSTTLTGQSVTGNWFGYLEILGNTLRIEIELERQGDQLSGVLRSLDQGALATPMDEVTLENNELNFEIATMNLTYTGTFQSEHQVIEGVLTQMGMNLPLKFGREVLEAIRPDRPQTPQPPFPYTERELQFNSSDPRYQLAGTITIPQDTVRAAVVLVSGSGPQDRDSFILNHRPFLVWADYLSRRGIAVLRFDERGVGVSEGVHDDCTTYDLANDVQAVHAELLKQLPDGVPSGIIGLSEGGLIAAIVASQTPTVDFIVSLAGPGVTGAELLFTQTIDIAMSQGMARAQATELAERNRQLHEIILDQPDSASTAKAMRDRLIKQAEAAGETFNEEVFNQYNSGLNTTWMRTFLTIDPKQYWSKVDCAVLALNGNLDLQVSAGANLRGIGFALRRNKNSQFSTQILENHNHLFQQAKTGAISEYGELTETVSNETLSTVAEWINARTHP